MKRLLVVFVVLAALATPLPAFNDHKGLTAEVIRMSQAGVSDDAIIEYVRHTSGRFVITADDVIALKNAGVSAAVIRVMIDESESRGLPERAGYSSRPPAPEIDRDPTPPWTAFYDPWWFMPRYYTPLPRTH